MTEQTSLTREIPYPNGGETPHHRITVESDAFGTNSMMVREAPRRIDKKINLRIRKEDNLLLKAIAEQSGLPNSTLLNQLLLDLLLKALLETEEEDARALLAVAADARASYDSFERPWCIDVAGRFSSWAIDNALEWNQLTAEPVQPPNPQDGITKADLHSDYFKELVRLFENKK